MGAVLLHRTTRNDADFPEIHGIINLWPRQFFVAVFTLGTIAHLSRPFFFEGLESLSLVPKGIRITHDISAICRDRE